MIRIEYFDHNHRRIGKTWFSQLKKTSMGSEGIVWNGVARLRISDRAQYFRMFWPGASTYEFCGNIW